MSTTMTTTVTSPEEVALNPLSLPAAATGPDRTASSGDDGPRMTKKEKQQAESSGRTNRLNLTFDDVSFTVRRSYNPLCRDRKKILSNVSGDFRSGELTAIMGPSGAGKTTLMNVLAGFVTLNVTGNVQVNGRPRDVAAFRRSSAYILQDGNLQPLLTVEEVMRIAADLKLDLPASDRQHGVDMILREMGLESKRSTLTGNLSGGEKKRLSIALELISNPPIMFFDEPTSGLDSVASRQCVGLMKSLALDGRTIVCTLHQPSAALLDMIDHLYVIANGKCVYAGRTGNVVRYLQGLELKCPVYHNPADYLLEIINGDYGEVVPKLIDAVANGRSQRWRLLAASSDESTGHREPIPKLRELELKPKLPLPVTSIFYEFEAKRRARYATSFIFQLWILLRRNVIRLSRDRTLTYSRISMHAIVGLLIGTLFYKTGQDGAYVKDNFNMYFFNIMTVMFNAFNSTIITFPEEMPVIIREHFNRWYRLRSFYLATKLSDLPLQVIAVSSYIVIVYLMSGQIFELWRLGYIVLICLLVSLISQNVGRIFGSIFNVKNGVIFGPFTILPFMIFSGFFVQMKDAHVLMQWLFHISFFKYAFEAVMVATYGYDRPKMECSQIYCHYSRPKILLKEFAMDNADFWFATYFLFGLYIALDIVAYFVLRFKLRNR